MKTKTKQLAKDLPNKRLSGISRVTQKTFIMAALLAYATFAFMMLHDTYRMLTSSPAFDTSPFLVYAIPLVALPLLAFVILFGLGNKKSAKVWRVFQAALLTLFIVIAYGIIMSLNGAIFQNQLGYGMTAATSNATLFQLIPLILSTLLTIGLAFWLKAKEKATNDISSKALKVMVASLLFLIFAQSLVTFIEFNVAGVPESVDSGTLAIAFMGFAVPVVAIAILYFVTSKLRPRVQRMFIATVYVLIGVLVTMTTVSLSYQLASLVGPGPVGSFLDGMSAWVGLSVFLGIVIWHKIGKVL